MRENRTLSSQNVLLRITFKNSQYIPKDLNQERKNAAENQYRLHMNADVLAQAYLHLLDQNHG